MPPNRLITRTTGSPIGPLTLGVAVGDRAGLCLLEFPGVRSSRGLGELESAFGCPAEPDAPDPTGTLDDAERQLNGYFGGDLTRFDLPLVTPGTDFQRRVWAELLTIPYGETTTYGELAERVESPGSQRAVGAANGRNRVAIVVPCHRVIDSTGRLHGYGGGLDRKRALLELEGALEPEPSLFT
jgi:O-6-methylguanine DNA methyltransferase